MLVASDTYLAFGRALVLDHRAPTTGIERFTALLEQVRTTGRGTFDCRYTRKSFNWLLERLADRRAAGSITPRRSDGRVHRANQGCPCAQGQIA